MTAKPVHAVPYQRHSRRQERLGAQSSSSLDASQSAAVQHGCGYATVVDKPALLSRYFNDNDISKSSIRNSLKDFHGSHRVPSPSAVFQISDGKLSGLSDLPFLMFANTPANSSSWTGGTDPTIGIPVVSKYRSIRATY
ncbi:hypothetical protein Y032_0016g3063 [Ancylostoma ceylanicum]|uniref:Uncharacterized protein n=1 Tax=Ancylostoma ceylanicum TaxID=53326 RepID=A0A016V7L3_9BILA|nr:hypothetical protein Y032_0016g3063 [Ancylostoma ceylanicum]